MLRLIVLALALQTLSVSAAQLDLALIRFPEPKTAEALNAALRGVSLVEITNSNRTMTSVSSLKGGSVLFAQSIAAGPVLQSSTRLRNMKADVKGLLKNSTLQVEIKLTEGVEAGLRRFSSRTYRGLAALTHGEPCVVSLQTVVEKTQTAVKGKAEVTETVTCNAIIAQLR
jgi:hypothetical protein